MDVMSRLDRLVRYIEDDMPDARLKRHAQRLFETMITDDTVPDEIRSIVRESGCFPYEVLGWWTFGKSLVAKSGGMMFTYEWSHGTLELHFGIRQECLSKQNDEGERLLGLDRWLETLGRLRDALQHSDSENGTIAPFPIPKGVSIDMESLTVAKNGRTTKPLAPAEWRELKLSLNHQPPEPRSSRGRLNGKLAAIGLQATTSGLVFR